MATVNNKVVWITGASSGIGEAIAKVMAEKGAKLILSSRKEDALLKVQSSLSESAKNESRVLPLDLSQPETLNEKVKEALSFFGKIDIIIHSGGISQRSMASDTPIEVDRRIMEINYFGTVLLTKAVLPSMIENGFGHIVPISSLLGKFGSPFRSGYAASKHALHGFFDSLRAEVYDKNIFITLVTPGFVRTNVSINAITEDGSPLNEMDDAQEKGMLPEVCARKIVRGIEQEKNELLMGGKETMAVYLKRFVPGLFAKIIRKAKVR
ncbi:MAG: short chain dehydrogenase [Bacteroidetes bacterium]|nr:MAG: short chain dehydrogenase [Bacteroidota bacterium]